MRRALGKPSVGLAKIEQQRFLNSLLRVPSSVLALARPLLAPTCRQAGAYCIFYCCFSAKQSNRFTQICPICAGCFARLDQGRGRAYRTAYVISFFVLFGTGAQRRRQRQRLRFVHSDLKAAAWNFYVDMSTTTTKTIKTTAGCVVRARVP